MFLHILYTTNVVHVVNYR